MATHSITFDVSYRGKKFVWTDSQTNGDENNIDESIPDSSTDLAVSWSVDVSAMSSCLIVADGGALTVKTNSSSTPDDTFTLANGEPIVWVTGSGLANPITTDITSGLFVTNSSGSAVTLRCYRLQDATP